jgi:hypothetical protein
MRSDLLSKEGSSGRSCESLYLDLCAPAAGPSAEATQSSSRPFAAATRRTTILVKGPCRG